MVLGLRFLTHPHMRAALCSWKAGTCWDLSCLFHPSPLPCNSPDSPVPLHGFSEDLQTPPEKGSTQHPHAASTSITTRRSPRDGRRDGVAGGGHEAQLQEPSHQGRDVGQRSTLLLLESERGPIGPARRVTNVMYDIRLSNVPVERLRDQN